MPQLQTLPLHAFERVLLTLQRAALRRKGPSRLPAHLATGERGELAALFHLRHEGYVIVARRWRHASQRGDLDLVAWEGDRLCFLEVKTRGSHDVASAEAAVNEDKRRILRKLARAYLKTVEPPPASVRFDLVTVYFEQDRQDSLLFRGAFGW